MNKKTLMYLFNLFLGTLILLWLFYRRIIVVRLPRDLYLWHDTTFRYGLLIFIILNILGCVLVIKYYIYIYLGRTIRVNIFHKIGEKFNDMIDSALEEVFTLICSFFSDAYEKLSYFSQKFYKYFKNRSTGLLLFILYFIRVVILFAFLVDTFMFFKLNYMYKALYLLCISLIIKLILYILRQVSYNLEIIQSFLIIEDRGIDEETQLPITRYQLRKEHKELDLQYYIEQYILCCKIHSYLQWYSRYVAFFNPYVNLFIYFLYLVGWLYILIVNFIP